MNKINPITGGITQRGQSTLSGLSANIANIAKKQEEINQTKEQEIKQEKETKEESLLKTAYNKAKKVVFYQGGWGLYLMSAIFSTTRYSLREPFREGLVPAFDRAYRVKTLNNEIIDVRKETFLTYKNEILKYLAPWMKHLGEVNQKKEEIREMLEAKVAKEKIDLVREELDKIRRNSLDKLATIDSSTLIEELGANYSSEEELYDECLDFVQKNWDNSEPAPMGDLVGTKLKIFGFNSLLGKWKFQIEEETPISVGIRHIWDKYNKRYIDEILRTEEQVVHNQYVEAITKDISPDDKKVQKKVVSKFSLFKTLAWHHILNSFKFFSAIFEGALNTLEVVILGLGYLPIILAGLGPLMAAFLFDIANTWTGKNAKRRVKPLVEDIVTGWKVSSSSIKRIDDGLSGFLSTAALTLPRKLGRDRTEDSELFTKGLQLFNPDIKAQPKEIKFLGHRQLGFSPKNMTIHDQLVARPILKWVNKELWTMVTIGLGTFVSTFVFAIGKAIWKRWHNKDELAENSNSDSKNNNSNNNNSENSTPRDFIRLERSNY